MKKVKHKSNQKRNLHILTSLNLLHHLLKKMRDLLHKEEMPCLKQFPSIPRCPEFQINILLYSALQLVRDYEVIKVQEQCQKVCFLIPANIEKIFAKLLIQ